MSSIELQQLADDATRIYEQRMRVQLEASHLHDFVAIEPESGDYFLGKILSEAMRLARVTHPTRRAFCLRVGHVASIEVGQYLLTAAKATA